MALPRRRGHSMATNDGTAIQITDSNLDSSTKNQLTTFLDDSSSESSAKSRAQHILQHMQPVQQRGTTLADLSSLTSTTHKLSTPENDADFAQERVRNENDVYVDEDFEGFEDLIAQDDATREAWRLDALRGELGEATPPAGHALLKENTPVAEDDKIRRRKAQQVRFQQHNSNRSRSTLGVPTRKRFRRKFNLDTHVHTLHERVSKSVDKFNKYNKYNDNDNDIVVDIENELRASASEHQPQKGTEALAQKNIVSVENVFGSRAQSTDQQQPQNTSPTQHQYMHEHARNGNINDNFDNISGRRSKSVTSSIHMSIHGGNQIGHHPNGNGNGDDPGDSPPPPPGAGNGNGNNGNNGNNNNNNNDEKVNVIGHGVLNSIQIQMQRQGDIANALLQFLMSKPKFMSETEKAQARKEFELETEFTPRFTGGVRVSKERKVRTLRFYYDVDRWIKERNKRGILSEPIMASILEGSLEGEALDRLQKSRIDSAKYRFTTTKEFKKWLTLEYPFENLVKHCYNKLENFKIHPNYFDWRKVYPQFSKVLNLYYLAWTFSNPRLKRLYHLVIEEQDQVMRMLKALPPIRQQRVLHYQDMRPDTWHLNSIRNICELFKYIDIRDQEIEVLLDQSGGIRDKRNQMGHMIGIFTQDPYRGQRRDYRRDNYDNYNNYNNYNNYGSYRKRRQNQRRDSSRNYTTNPRNFYTGRKGNRSRSVYTTQQQPGYFDYSRPNGHYRREQSKKTFDYYRGKYRGNGRSRGRGNNRGRGRSNQRGRGRGRSYSPQNRNPPKYLQSGRGRGRYRGRGKQRGRGNYRGNGRGQSTYPRRNQTPHNKNNHKSKTRQRFDHQRQIKSKAERFYVNGICSLCFSSGHQDKDCGKINGDIKAFLRRRYESENKYNGSYQVQTVQTKLSSNSNNNSNNNTSKTTTMEPQQRVAAIQQEEQQLISRTKTPRSYVTSHYSRSKTYGMSNNNNNNSSNNNSSNNNARA